jgi:hypothetical protein
VRRRPRAAAVAVAVAAGLGACGTPSADLFVVERSGSLPDADLELVVGDGGSVECDGVERPISSDQLLRARELARDLEPVLARRVRLSGGRGSLLRYRVLGEQGEARFADVSAARDRTLGRVVAFTRDVARRACGRAR